MTYEESEDSLPLETVKEQIIEDLKDQYARGLIDEALFESLVRQTHEVSNDRELAVLADSLPDLHDPDESDGYKSKGHEHKRERPEHHSRGHRHFGDNPNEDTIVSIMGENKRRGVWKPAKSIKVLAIMSDTDLDFRDALLDPGTTAIDIFCLMADVDIIVPPGVNVEFSGVPLLSSHKNMTSVSYDRDAPTIKISGFSLMADILIKEG